MSDWACLWRGRERQSERELERGEEGKAQEKCQTIIKKGRAKRGNH
jgi:hypothetical protein